MPETKLLVHICCAPCFIAPYQDLKLQGMNIQGYWFNPNIHPYTEYRMRLQTLKDYAEAEGIPILYHDEYALDEFIQRANTNLAARCSQCYTWRLQRTAMAAAENGFTAFTSTLLYSRYQDHQSIIEVAERLAKQYGIEFYYQDYRELWNKGIELSKQKAMYRQKYCGCIYSERDRYLKQKQSSQ